MRPSIQNPAARGATVDRRQALDQFSAAASIGDLADDVLIACARADTGLSESDRAAVSEAIRIVGLLVREEGRASLTPSTLSCMAPVAIDSVIGSSTESSGEIVATLGKIESDLTALYEGRALPASARRRLRRFFENLASHTLTYSETVLESFGNEKQWMFAAPNYF